MKFDRKDHSYCNCIHYTYIHRIHTTRTKSPAAAGLEVGQDPEHVRVVEVDHGVATQDQVEWFLDLVCHQVVLLQSGHNQGSIQNESYIYVMYHM